MLRIIVHLCLGCWLILQAGPGVASATTTVLPIRLDYPLLRSFIVQQAFTEPNETAIVIDEFDGCQFLKLARPDLYPENGFLRLKSQVTLKTGLPVLDTCQMPVELEGIIDVRLNVRLDATGWTLHFQTEDLRLTTADGRSLLLSAPVLDLVRERLFGHLDQVAINLAIPVQGIQEMLPLFFQDENQTRIATWLKGIRPGRIEARPDTYSVELIMEVADEVSQPLAAAPAEKGLSAEELDRFVRGWEAWDAFLVYEIGRLGLFELEEQDRTLVLQTLLESRYQLAAALASERSAPGDDLVRRQFATVWERFAPLFRKYLARDPSAAPFSFLVYLSAGDALAALDRLGPTMGLEISRDGLIRMARLLTDGGPEVTLDYSFEVDPGLRKMLGFGPPLPAPNQVFPGGEEVDLVPPAANGGAEGGIPPFRPLTWLLSPFTPRPAYAALQPPVNLQALKRWLVEDSNFDSYLQQIRTLMQEETKQSVATGKLAPARSDFFTKLLQATAWQESCFRQFTVKAGKMTYLRSWNNTSVGLMQINERVWRGLYRIDALRWDPRYNIQAGGEILRLYLSDYVLKKASAPTLNEEGMARATYALYNSGPQNFKGFLGRHAKRDYLTSDKLFWEKYTWAKAGEFERLKSCLFGE